MKVEPFPELKQLFLERLKEKNSRPRPNVSVSDLVYCLRESYFKKTNPKPPTPKQLGFYSDGARRHEVLQILSELASEVKVERYHIRGHVDMLVESPILRIRIPGPIEFKSTRARKNLADSYFLQLAFYSLMLGINHGYLIVQRLIKNDEEDPDPWECYKITWTEEEMLNLDYELFSRANLLRTALEKKDPSILPRVGKGMEWKCRECSWRSECGR